MNGSSNGPKVKAFVSTALCVAVVGGCGLVVACGSPAEDVASSSAAVSGQWLDGARVSSEWTFQLLDATGTDPVLIDTATADGEARRVSIRWEDDGREQVAVDRQRAALILPLAWMGDREVFVTGLTCAEPDLVDLEDFGENDPAASCGGTEPAFSLRAFDLESSSWREVSGDVPLRSSYSVDVIGAGGSVAVLRGGATELSDVETLYEVDLSSGKAAKLEDDLGGAPVVGCATEGGLLALVGGGVDQAGAGEGATLWKLSGAERQVVAEYPRIVVELGCAAGGMLVWSASEEQMELAKAEGGVGTTDRVDLPAGLGDLASTRVVPQRNVGGTPALWSSHPDGLSLWAFDGQAWNDLGVRWKGSDPPTVAAVGTDHVVVLDEVDPSLLRVLASDQ